MGGREPSHAMPTFSTSPVPSEGSATRVLYLEDHAPLRSLIVDCMRKAGYDVECAEDGAEGWRKFCAVPFDLVVTDLHMPNLDGLGFIRLVRESKRPVRIMVYSSDMSEPTLSSLHKLGVTALVPKQANWEILRKMMAGIMRINPQGLAPQV